MSADEWKAQIQAQKDLVSSLQSGIEKLNESIQFAPGNCVSGCVQWNERQKQKQQEVERARTQLESQKRRLESMQDSARKQGYGSSVYDP
jgi:predicted ribosome quality control (RQC) complex YloA/Tae2 family protein